MCLMTFARARRGPLAGAKTPYAYAGPLCPGGFPKNRDCQRQGPTLLYALESHAAYRRTNRLACVHEHAHALVYTNTLTHSHAHIDTHTHARARAYARDA
jgi:hypothetical protein